MKTGGALHTPVAPLAPRRPGAQLRPAFRRCVSYSRTVRTSLIDSPKRNVRRAIRHHQKVPVRGGRIVRTLRTYAHGRVIPPRYWPFGQGPNTPHCRWPRIASSLDYPRRPPTSSQAGSVKGMSTTHDGKERGSDAVPYPFRAAAGPAIRPAYAAPRRAAGGGRSRRPRARRRGPRRPRPSHVGAGRCLGNRARLNPTERARWCPLGALRRAWEITG